MVSSICSLGLTNCIDNPFAKSELPEKMPENTSFRYSRNGGMAPSWYRVEVKGLQILVEDKDMQKDNADKWSASITLQEKIAIYKIFVENKFDLVENYEPDSITYDAVSEGVYLRAGKVSSNVSYGDNSPLSRINSSRYRAVANAIKELAKKYESVGKSVPENSVVIVYQKAKHSWMFRDAKLPASIISKSRKPKRFLKM